MNQFNDEYYIATETYGEDKLYVNADQKTVERGYHYKKVPLGEAPFFFYNGNKEEDLANGNKWPVTEILEVAGDWLVNDVVRDELKKYDIQGMQLYPSVYIDDDDNWHENYWFLNFYEQYRYFNKELSVIRYDYDDEADDDDDLEVRKYCLDEKILQEIPEEKRLLFKMGGVNLQYAFVHQKIVDFIEASHFKGIRFFKVSEFKEGKQFKP